MLRTLRRHPLLLVAVSAALVGVVLAGNAQAIDPSRDAKDDPGDSRLLGTVRRG